MSKLNSEKFIYFDLCKKLHDHFKYQYAIMIEPRIDSIQRADMILRNKDRDIIVEIKKDFKYIGIKNTEILLTYKKIWKKTNLGNIEIWIISTGKINSEVKDFANDNNIKLIDYKLLKI
jgi:hypothetical protein